MSAPPSPDDRPPVPDLRWSGLTHRGRKRANNEDNFLALTFDRREVRYLGKVGEASAEQADFVFAVSDGMGGAKSGEFASRITIEKISHLLPKTFALTASGLDGGFAELLGELFDAIHQELLKLDQSYEECRGMGTTLSLCWLAPGRMYFAHIGDSRIYHLPRAGGLMQISHDHSHVGWLRRRGEINEREARTHPLRNSLQQALGAGHQFVDPQIGIIPCEAGDRFLLCSDGLIDGLWDRQIEELIREPAPDQAVLPPAQRLVEAALENSGRDNITAVVIETIARADPAA